MKGDTFTSGDRVALSATFLRSLGTVSFGGRSSGLSRYDVGKGIVIQPVDFGGGFILIDVWFFKPAHWRRLNPANLVHERDITKEARQAEWIF